MDKVFLGWVGRVFEMVDFRRRLLVNPPLGIDCLLNFGDLSNKIILKLDRMLLGVR